MNKFKKAHEMARTIKNIYKDVDYNFQFVLCLKLLCGKELPKQPPKKKERWEEIEERLKKVKENGVNIKYNLWVSGLRKWLFVTAFQNGIAYKLGYVDTKDGYLFSREPIPENMKETNQTIREELKRYRIENWLE